MNFQQLKYGWYALIGVILTGTTIYVVNNQRHRVEQVDIIELVLGVQERCLATQYSTNPVSYYVYPLSFISYYKDTNYFFPGIIIPPYFNSWQILAYRVCYTTYWPNAIARTICYTTANLRVENPRGQDVYAKSFSTTGGYVWVTNSYLDWEPISSLSFWAPYENPTVTNLIGWYLDHDLLISLDAKIKALVPYYCDTNTVYDGTTNIVMLTVTGLWASLQIGDGTNKFTREPCWTNPVSTNWIVNYMSYWPSTSGVATNINYTSDYRQVINYAQSWTATGGHVWVASSNWPSEVVTVTNAATYGDYPWQIYAEDLVERYKVLNALKMTAPSFSYSGFGKLITLTSNNTDLTGLAQLKSDATTAWSSTNSVGANGTPYASSYIRWVNGAAPTNINWQVSLYRAYGRWSVPLINTSVTHSVLQGYVRAEPWIYNEISRLTYDPQGDSIYTNKYTLYLGDTGDAVTVCQASLPAPSWGIIPTNSGIFENKGYQRSNYGYVVIPWNFRYCTNKYW